MKNHSVGYWGDKSDWEIEFITMNNTADYTAAAAINMISKIQFQKNLKWS
jgi:hypothetical protein